MTDSIELARRASREQTAMIGLFALLLAGASAIPQYERSLMPGGQGAALVAGGSAPSGAVFGLTPLDAVRVVLPPARQAFRTASPTIRLAQDVIPGTAVPAALVLPGSPARKTGLEAEPAGPRFALARTAIPGVATDFASPSLFRSLPGGGSLTGGARGGGAIGGGGGGGATPAPSPTPAPTATPPAAPTASPSQSPSPTPAPTASLSLTPTPTPAPSSSPSSGPTLLPTPAASRTPRPTPTHIASGPGTPRPTPIPGFIPDPLPNGMPPGIIPPLSGVPEPGTWLLFVTGMGIAGAAMRRRPRPKRPTAKAAG